MTKKRKLVYTLTVLLFLCLLAAIARLAYMVFSFRISPLPEVAAVPSPGPRHTPVPGPVSETVIDAGAPAEDDAENPAVTQPSAATEGTGSSTIPCVCEGQDQELRRRKSFPYPLTHQSMVSPTHITVTLTIPTDATTETVDNL